MITLMGIVRLGGTLIIEMLSVEFVGNSIMTRDI